ncbi:MAG: TonB-dependent receptor [bacterium]|nr:TonB-dependent receptor [bacterium]
MRKVFLRHTLWGVLLTIGILFPPVVSAQVQVTISGKIADELENPIANAMIVLEPEQAGSRLEITTQEDGRFNISRDLSIAGAYRLSAHAPGYYELKKPEPIILVVGLNIISVQLIKEEMIKNSLTVTADIYSPAHLKIEQLEMSQQLSAKQIDNVPVVRAAKLENAIAALPGVAKDQTGQLHLYGSPADQINWLFNGFSLNDPASGKLEANIGIESIGGINAFASRYSVEYGPGSGGTISLETKSPTNKHAYHFTDAVPGIEFNNGLKFNSWGPQLNFSGPIKKDRAWYFLGLNTEYRKSFIRELPETENEFSYWNSSGVSRFQLNLSPRHTLHAGLLYNYFDAPQFGLNPFAPLETTAHRRSRRTFLYAKDQFFLSPKTMFEIGYGFYRSGHREEPRGQKPYQLFGPYQKGNYPFDRRQDSDRHELLINALLTPWSFYGTHQWKVGGNFQYLRYDQDIMRSSIEYFRVDGTKSFAMNYGGNGQLSKANLESALYFQDRWTIPGQPWLMIEGGLRVDYNRLLGQLPITPRFSLAALPPWLKTKTKFSAGFGLIPEKINLALFTRPLDQFVTFTRFSPDGRAQQTSLRFLPFTPQALKMSTITNTSFGVEQGFPYKIFLQFNYLRKRGQHGYTFFQVPSLRLNSDLLYRLQSSKSESFNFMEVAISKQFLNKYDWFASYAWSKAISNAALDINAEDAIVHRKTAGRLAWDTPHRLTSWGIFPLGQKEHHQFSYFLEWRDGFPYFAYNDQGEQVGNYNFDRLPRQFNLNIRYAWKFRFWRYGLRLQLGFDNIANRANYNFVNQNISSSAFGALSGSQPRRFVVGLRFLNKDQIK